MKRTIIRSLTSECVKRVHGPWHPKNDPHHIVTYSIAAITSGTALSPGRTTGSQRRVLPSVRTGRRRLATRAFFWGLVLSAAALMSAAAHLRGGGGRECAGDAIFRERFATTVRQPAHDSPPLVAVCRELVVTVGKSQVPLFQGSSRSPDPPGGGAGGSPQSRAGKRFGSERSAPAAPPEAPGAQAPWGVPL